MMIHRIRIWLFLCLLIDRMNHEIELYVLNIILLHKAPRVPMIRFCWHADQRLINFLSIRNCCCATDEHTHPCQIQSRSTACVRNDKIWQIAKPPRHCLTRVDNASIPGQGEPLISIFISLGSKRRLWYENGDVLDPNCGWSSLEWSCLFQTACANLCPVWCWQHVPWPHPTPFSSSWLSPGQWQNDKTIYFQGDIRENHKHKHKIICYRHSGLDLFCLWDLDSLSNDMIVGEK